MSPNFFRGPKHRFIVLLFLVGATISLIRVFWVNVHDEVGQREEPVTVVIEDPAQAINQIEKDWFQSWSGRRGIETTDYNNQLVLVKANLDEVSTLLAPSFNSWQQNVLSQLVSVGEESVFIFQLEGHQWTELLSWKYATKPMAQYLSDKFQTGALFYAVSDTSASLEYAYFEKGILQGSLRRESDEPMDCFVRENSDLELIESDRQCDVDALMIYLDALEPGIAEDYFWEVDDPPIGDRKMVQNPGFILVSEGNRYLKTTPTFQRVDYLAN